MSRKDYVLIASTIREEILTAEAMYEPIGAAAMRRLAEGLADRFALDNERFDRARFLTACGVTA
jgi:hypothetical protein